MTKGFIHNPQSTLILQSWEQINHDLNFSILTTVLIVNQADLELNIFDLDENNVDEILIVITIMFTGLIIATVGDKSIFSQLSNQPLGETRNTKSFLRL